MTVLVNTNVSFSGLDFDVGTNSLDGTIIIDFDMTSMTGTGNHCGVAFNRRGNRTDGGGAVAGVNRLWWEAQGIFVNVSGEIWVETWFHALTCRPEQMSTKVGSVGANKLFRITHTTSGVDRTWSINAISALGGTAGALLGSGTYSTGSLNDMRSGFFSPFATATGVTYRCIRKD